MWLLLLLMSVSPSWSGRGDQAPELTRQQAYAEYIRLSHELEILAKRNQWVGVERLYTEMVELGVELRFQDHKVGAFAARSVGDVTTAWDRINLALELEAEDPELRGWQDEFRRQYGRVSLYGDPGVIELSVEQVPFNPDYAKVVEFAQQRVSETGFYEGYLPEGTYHFGHHAIRVMPRVRSASIDIRTDEYLEELEAEERKQERAERRRHRKNKGADPAGQTESEGGEAD